MLRLYVPNNYTFNINGEIIFRDFLSGKLAGDTIQLNAINYGRYKYQKKIETILRKEFNENATVDVSDGYQDNIHIVVVS